MSWLTKHFTATLTVIEYNECGLSVQTLSFTLGIFKGLGITVLLTQHLIKQIITIKIYVMTT